MISEKKIDKKIKDTFRLKNFYTLSDVEDKIRYELSENDNVNVQFDKVYLEAVKIVTNYFFDKNLWIRVNVWNETDDSILSNLVLKPLKEDLKFKRNEEEGLVVYFFLDRFELNKSEGLIKSSVGYELGLEEKLNITCLYFNFDELIILNIYDDRGIDVVCK